MANEIFFTNDRTTWLNVTDVARKLWSVNAFNLYELMPYDGDYLTSIIETEAQLEEVLSTDGSKICIQVERMPMPQPFREGWKEADKMLIRGEWWVKAGHVKIR